MIRKTADWWAKWDDRFVEYLYERGPASAGEIANSDMIEVDASYVSRRLKVLSNHGLVSHIQSGVYELTREGRFYLAGGYDLQSESYLHETEFDGDIKTYDRMLSYIADLNCQP